MPVLESADFARADVALSQVPLGAVVDLTLRAPSEAAMLTRRPEIDRVCLDAAPAVLLPAAAEHRR